MLLLAPGITIVSSCLTAQEQAALLKVVRALAGWAEDNAAGILDSRTAFDAR